MAFFAAGSLARPGSKPRAKNDPSEEFSFAFTGLFCLVARSCPLTSVVLCAFASAAVLWLERS